MSSLNEIIAAFEDIGRTVGTGLRKQWQEKCVDIRGRGIVLRVYWELERDPGVYVTIFKDVDLRRKKPKEISLRYLIEFKKGDPADVRLASSSETNAETKADLVRKYAMDYLLGRAKDFSAVEDYTKEKVKAEIREKYPYLENIKNLKFLRPEWIPADE